MTAVPATSATRRLLLVVTLLTSLGITAAQSDDRATVQRAAAALDGSSFHFEHSFWPAAEALSPTTGAGTADLGAHRWDYTLRTDPDDPTAERHADGRWIIIDTAWYHDGGDGWTQDAIDFTYAGVAAVIQPFASYAQIELLAGGDPDALQPLRSLGEAVVDGLPATGYAFATRGSPFFGSTDFEAWLSEGPNGYQRIVLIVTPVDGQPNRVTFTRIGEPVVIEAPL